MTDSLKPSDTSSPSQQTSRTPSHFSALQAAANLLRRPIFSAKEKKETEPAVSPQKPTMEDKPVDEYAGMYPSNEPEAESKPVDEYVGLYPSNEPESKPVDEYAGLYPSNDPEPESKPVQAVTGATDELETPVSTENSADEYAGLYPSNEPEASIVDANGEENLQDRAETSDEPQVSPEASESSENFYAPVQQAEPTDDYAELYSDSDSEPGAEPGQEEQVADTTPYEEQPAPATIPTEAESADEPDAALFGDTAAAPFTEENEPQVQDGSMAESYAGNPSAPAADENEMNSFFGGMSQPAPAPAFQPDQAEEDVGVSAGLSTDPRDLEIGAEDTAPVVELSAQLDIPQDHQAYEEITSEPDDSELRTKLMALQEKIRTAKIPVVIVFEGWDTAGKGTLVSKLIEGLDPRGYQVYPIRKPTEEELRYPAMRRYWVKTPAQGNISIFCSSWYREVSNACFESKSARKRLHQSYEEIINLESELACSGALIIKFFLHISRKEQKERLKVLESKKNTRWRVTDEDWEQNERYEEYLRLFDAMIARTHYDGMLWHVLRSEDRQTSVKQVYNTVIAEFQAALKDREIGERTWDTPFLPHLENMNTRTFPPLDTFDPEQALTEPYKPAVDKAQKQLRRLQNELYRRGIPMAVCFEGWDAAGKGGAIRRLTSSLDARGFDVVPIAAPTPLEGSHHYLWRFWDAVPKNGHIAIFDRTWYGRVMVERIEGFCTEPEWKRAYEEINRFEADLTSHGMILCKFWLQIDNNTQLVRFQERQTTPDKQWKITDEDWRNRSKWPQYETAVNEMLQKTNTSFGPWTVVEANNKQFARLKVLQTVIRAIEERLEKE